MTRFGNTLQRVFDRETGLWRQFHAGHTAPTASLDSVHSGPDSASLLLIAAQLGNLRNLPSGQILAALEDLQATTDGPHLGCFRWYAEDPEVIDSNAAFFIGLNLIVLQIAFADQLDQTARDRLARMLERMRHWFARELEAGLRYYPNKFLGDVVCHWLLLEILGQDTKPFETLMEDTARYYLDSPWGWGEHLSDPYTTILLDELSCLLVLARKLPAKLFARYREMLRNLLTLEDFFDGGPRVPTVRSYAFAHAPSHHNYRSSVRRWTSPDRARHNPEQLSHLLKFNFGPLFYEAGWHELAGAPATGENPRIRRVPCFNGHSATAWISGDRRIGSISQYPFMPNCDYPTYGLSWQSMPVAFQAGKGNWGFLRWTTIENSTRRAHPARDKASAYLHNALSDSVAPSIVGQTFSAQTGGAVVTLRRMPVLARQWESLADEFFLTGFEGQFTELQIEGGWQQLLIYGENGRDLACWFHPLESGGRAQVIREGNALAWRVCWTQSGFGKRTRIATLWAVSLEARDKQSVPRIVRMREPLDFPRSTIYADSRWQLHWAALDPREWIVDPVADDPWIKQG